MSYRALALALFTALILSSCAKEERAASSNPGAYTIPVENLAEGQQIAKNAVLECGNNCSPSLGLLAFATPEEAGQCSAFLVAPDVVATNSHCVPKDLKEPGTSCKDRVWVHFANHGSYESRIGCEKVIYDSKNYQGATDLPDYAYLKLAKASARPALRISRDGFPEGAEMKIEKVNPVKGAGRMKGSQEVVRCRTVQNSVNLESFFHNLAPVALVSECEVIPGNSGSPVIALDGTARGVVFAFREPSDIEEVFAKNKDLALKEDFVSFNYVANYACLRSPEGGVTLPPVCGGHEMALRLHLVKRGRASTEAVIAAVERQMAALPAFADLGWTAFLEKSKEKTAVAYAGVEVSAVPRCVRPSAAAAFGTGVELSLPTWRIREDYDRYLRSEAVLSAPKLVKTRVKVFAVGANEYTVLLNGEGFVRKLENLPTCE